MNHEDRDGKCSVLTAEVVVNRGWLRHGNPPGDLSKAKPCGARRRRQEARCKAPAMKNGRCRIHGGLSTGPRTPEGLERSRHANWKHGLFSVRAKAIQREARQNRRQLRKLFAQLGL